MNTLHPAHQLHMEARSRGDRAADRVAAIVATWRFILTQNTLLALWIGVNVLAVFVWKWDPYPFILLNLLLSFQAANTAPIIMMSQKRSDQMDRAQAAHDHALLVRNDALMDQQMLLLAQHGEHLALLAAINDRLSPRES